MRYRAVLSVALTAAVFILAAGRPVAASEDWPPITDEEKAMKDCPQQPGATAVFLEREDIRDDSSFTRSYFRRMKILTPAGKERANIEIPFAKGISKISGLKARLVRTDGGTVPFTGQVFEKTALRSGRLKVTVETFAIPDVDVGCIIDYRYKIVPDTGASPSERSMDALENLLGPRGKPREGGVSMEEGVSFFPIDTWDVQEDLFTCRAKFAYEHSELLEHLLSRDIGGVRLNWVTHGLGGRNKPQQNHGRIELELENIPAFEPEEYMTPESTQRMEVRLFYLEATADSPDKYWKGEARSWQKGMEKFVRKAGDAAAEEQRLVAGIDDPLGKLKKLYARAQEIKNLSYDRTMTKQRMKELKIKDNHSVADVLKNNYGWRSDITRTFAALADAAGFDAKVVRVATRDDKFFDKNACGLYSQLDTELAMIRINGKEQLFDPATPFCPVGLVRWSCTGTVCLTPSGDPPAFVATPPFPPETALTLREISLRLDSEGNMDGTARVTFSGQEALMRRLEHIADDEIEVKKDLEAEMSEILPAGSKVTLQKVENMTNSADRVVAAFDVAIPGIATSAGQKMIIPASPLLGSREHPFRHAQRKYPVYLRYARREFDDIVIVLPAGMTVETTPAPRQNRSELFDYSLACAVDGPSRLHAQRDLVIKKTYFPAEKYPLVKSFFDQVLAGDEEQVVLATAKK